jgi:quercetin dioxygenase-like cupin family protein
MINFDDNTEVEKLKVYNLLRIIGYVPNAVLSKTILKKITGNITLFSVDAGEELAEKLSPFDIFIQIIDGAAQLNINHIGYDLGLGEAIIIPAHTFHSFHAFKQFKMLSTVIKSGYEDLV